MSDPQGEVSALLEGQVGRGDWGGAHRSVESLGEPLCGVGET